MTKLWEKGYSLNDEMEKFTVGDDFLLDQKLVKMDVIGSIAHARMLTKIGILKEDEFARLKGALVEILRLYSEDKFHIEVEDEDVHTKVENYLTDRLGDLGKKIHTARSRNDQVIVDLRLYTKERLLEILKSLLRFCETLWEFSKENEGVIMPGRTHTQPAMPSSVGLWASALLESLLDDFILIRTAYDINNQCPLGSAASYGVPLDIDRQLTSDLLGFEKVQNNVLYANNSRGKTESIVLFALSQVMLDLSKLATDLILFSTREFGYFNLPEELCCGSSIMPQKRNPAGMELIRAKTSTMLSYLFQVTGTIKALPSGYNRDLQETKSPLLKGMDLAESSIKVCDLVISRLKVNEEVLDRACTPEVFATDRALELVKEGKPFRDAYREVAANLDKLEITASYKDIFSRKHIGAAGNLGLPMLKDQIDSKMEWVGKEKRAFEAKIEELKM
ncbi:MAG: argininosuccinate lyase [Deltaproteobacteria bacterium CG_4_9_14_3_um_filter_44_9]|nr:MAG: argininosuccinate lyase [Deltaproteobacteria bacterium CG_4_9_14_3_um_filter_44_9]